MNRGFFSFVSENELYQTSKKKWVVEVQQYHKYWYDLIVNPDSVAPYFNTRELIVNNLKKLKKTVEHNLEKRFIYFICTRTRVRFDTKRKFWYNPITLKAHIPILIGNKKKKTLKFEFINIDTGKLYKPKVQISDKFITFDVSNKNKLTFSIHDFLEYANIDLGISSNVEYVGYTKNPHTRPTGGAHTGLSDVLYQNLSNDNDVFIYFNTFKVTAIGGRDNFYFATSNAMTNEVDVDEEGEIIEKSFIFYFNSENQKRNKNREYQELNNKLLNLLFRNKIQSIYYNYEFEQKSDYAKFSSSEVKADSCHKFKVEVIDNKVKILRGGKIDFDAELFKSI